ncbi:MAG: tRNA lysidine(34) synthetase TilS, partial [Candidatus Hydrogenedentota bacterium]
MKGMVEIVEAFLAEHLPDGKPARLGVAVSGGIDSMTLLHVVRRLASRSLFIPVVLHFDHDLRPGSDEDRKFVEKAARECGLEVHSEKRTLESREGSVEEWARKARYAFLERAARKLALDAVVTAHHADDQAETVLFRLLRGTGIRGLAGIPPVRNSGGLLI